MIRLKVVEKPFFMDGPIKRYENDIYSEENETQANEYIRLGWCENADTGECGERKPGAQLLKVNDIATPVR